MHAAIFRPNLRKPYQDCSRCYRSCFRPNCNISCGRGSLADWKLSDTARVPRAAILAESRETECRRSRCSARFRRRMIGRRADRGPGNLQIPFRWSRRARPLPSSRRWRLSETWCSSWPTSRSQFLTVSCRIWCVELLLWVLGRHRWASASSTFPFRCFQSSSWPFPWSRTKYRRNRSWSWSAGRRTCSSLASPSRIWCLSFWLVWSRLKWSCFSWFFSFCLSRPIFYRKRSQNLSGSRCRQRWSAVGMMIDLSGSSWAWR